MAELHAEIPLGRITEKHLNRMGRKEVKTKRQAPPRTHHKAQQRTKRIKHNHNPRLILIQPTACVEPKTTEINEPSKKEFILNAQKN